MNIDHRIFYYDIKFLYNYVNSNVNDIDILLKVGDSRLRFNLLLTYKTVRLNVSKRSFPFRLVDKQDSIRCDIRRSELIKYLKQNVNTL